MSDITINGEPIHAKLEEAANIMFDHAYGSELMLMRQLKTSRSVACFIVMQLAWLGVIKENPGNGRRELLCSREDFQNKMNDIRLGA